MIPEKVIYTDGHDVTVTDTKLKVKNHSYKLSGITKHALMTMRAKKLPFIIIMGLGLLLALMGLFVDFAYAIDGGGDNISLNSIFLWTGLALLIAGTIGLAVNRVKYAVRIDTAEGEKNAVVSTKKAYITQIFEALNEAFRNRVAPDRKDKKIPIS